MAGSQRLGMSPGRRLARQWNGRWKWTDLLSPDGKAWGCGPPSGACV